jgi:hypothetical protein
MLFKPLAPLNANSQAAGVVGLFFLFCYNIMCNHNQSNHKTGYYKGFTNFCSIFNVHNMFKCV